MDVKVHSSLLADPFAVETVKQIGKCVHCGFCLPACPTYGLDQDERSSPRGRIFLVKGLLEGSGDALTVRRHLDGCLTCRSCEKACPSGVGYARIAHFGREAAEREVPRSLAARGARWLVHASIRSRSAGRLARLGMRAGGFLLPARLRRSLARPLVQRRLPASAGSGDPVILLGGCAQEGLMPSTNAALSKLLTLAGYEVRTLPDRCCGALASHMGMRRQAIAAIGSLLSGIPLRRGERIPPIVAAASGCASFIREYPHLDLPREMTAQALRVAPAVVDPAILLEERREALAQLKPCEGRRISVHAPCTQTNGLGTPGGTVGALLGAVGFEAVAPRDPPNCCGSAGTFSIFSPGPAGRLRRRMVDSLEGAGCDMVASSNIGCIMHLRQATAQPVHHWAELIAAEPRRLPQR